MSEETKFDRIESKLEDLKDSYYGIDKKMDLTLDRLETHLKEDSQNLQNITESIREMSKQLDVYNKELSIHIAGVEELKVANRLFAEKLDLEKSEVNARLSRAEAPMNWLDGSMKISIWLAAVAGGVTAIGMIIRWLLKV